MQERLYDRLKLPEIPALNGLRAVAVFTVIGFHTVNRWFPGRFGVLIFFVLSGFLITWLLLKESASTGRVSLTAFYKRRSLRIFPAFYVFWLLQVFVLAAIPWPLVTSCAAYVGNYYVGAVLHTEAPVMGHTWSLAVEEQFYLLWPLIFAWQRHNLRRLAWYLAGVVLAVQILRILLFKPGVNGLYVAYAFETRCDALAIGCLIAILLWTQPKIPSWLFSRAAIFAPISVVLACTFVERYDQPGSLLYCFGPVAAASALLIVQAITLSDRGLFALLNHPVMNYLGKISYPLYLYHLIVHQFTHDLPASKVVKGIISLPLLILVASASYFFVEKPFLKLKNRKIQPAPDAIIGLTNE